MNAITAKYPGLFKSWLRRMLSHEKTITKTTNVKTMRIREANNAAI